MFGKNVLRSSGLLPRSFCGRVWSPCAPSELLGEVPIGDGAQSQPSAGIGAPRRTPWGAAALISSYLPLSGHATEHCPVPWSLALLICEVGAAFFCPAGARREALSSGVPKASAAAPARGEGFSQGDQALGGKGSCAVPPDPRHAAVSLFSSERAWGQAYYEDPCTWLPS